MENNDPTSNVCIYDHLVYRSPSTHISKSILFLRDVSPENDIADYLLVVDRCTR
jgi:hypothetical protein